MNDDFEDAKNILDLLINYRIGLNLDNSDDIKKYSNKCDSDSSRNKICKQFFQSVAMEGQVDNDLISELKTKSNTIDTRNSTKIEN